MQANEEVAKKLSELTLKAKLQRTEMKQEITEIRNQPKSLSSIGLTAIKTARTIGIDELKVLLPIAKTFVIPAALTVGRILIDKSSPKRVAGAAAVMAAALGIFKGIQYDNRVHREDEMLPVVEEQPPVPETKDK